MSIPSQNTPKSISSSWGYDPSPAGGAYSLAGFKEAASRQEGNGGEESEGLGEGEEGKAKEMRREGKRGKLGE